MIKQLFICSIFIVGLLPGAASAAEIKEIELRDGSVLSGEVISLSNGVYTIKSDLLGTIKLEDSKVKAIRDKSPVSGVAAPAPAAGTAGEIQTLQQKMTGDKEIMSMIQSLQNDPEFQALLKDPNIMKAVQAGDAAALTADPRFMKLLNNPTVREIQQKVK